MKKAYTAPQLMVHGSVKDLTLEPEHKDHIPCPTDKYGLYSCGPHS